MTPLLAVQVVLPDSKPGLPSSCAEVQVPPPEEPTVQVKEAEPEAPVLSEAETVTLYVPAVPAVPEIRPVELLIDRPVGRPLALW
jgi:hypothetical protein